MKKIIVPLLAAFVLFAAISATPVDDELVQAFRQHVDPNWNNVISVPDNCKPGEVLINGICREIWSAVVEYLKESQAFVDWYNVISVPDNCAEGELLINGICREVWSAVVEYLKESLSSSPDYNNVVSVPDNCPNDQILVEGVCKEVWRVAQERFDSLDEAQKTTILRGLLASSDFSIKNIISVPTQCPEGYRPDASGTCREIWG